MVFGEIDSSGNTIGFEPAPVFSKNAVVGVMPVSENVPFALKRKIGDGVSATKLAVDCPSLVAMLVVPMPSKTGWIGELTPPPGCHGDR
jgi:hypothetical protein